MLYFGILNKLLLLGKPTILGNPPFFKWVGGFNHQPFPGILREEKWMETREVEEAPYDGVIFPRFGWLRSDI